MIAAMLQQFFDIAHASVTPLVTICATCLTMICAHQAIKTFNRFL